MGKLAYSKLYRHAVNWQHGVFIWLQRVDFPFNELIISWNALRPIKGSFSFSFRVLQQQWSPWISLADWGRDNDGNLLQRTFSNKNNPKVDVDTILINEGHAFEVKVEAMNGADLSLLHTLWASCVKKVQDEVGKDPLVGLPSTHVSGVSGISQKSIDHPAAISLCSPTSTYMLASFFSMPSIKPVESFLGHVYDTEHRIFGNWVLNVAGAYELAQIECVVHRLSSFKELNQCLENGFPVVVSVLGKLTNAFKEYVGGHLMVVAGYDDKQKKVCCFDPAFKSNRETKIFYSLDEFINVWSRRYGLCYLMGSMAIEPFIAH